MSGGRIAVTGADGYIGRRVVARLPNTEVVRLSRRKPASLVIPWAPFDLADSAPALPDDVAAVIHLAADVSFKLTPQKELANLSGLLVAAKSVGATFVFVSSQSAKSPRSEYGERKAAAEELVRRAGGVIVRPGLVIGGRRPKGLAAQIVALSRMPILPDFGRMAQTQTIHVEDLAEALVLIARGSGGRTLELAGPLMPLSRLFARIADRTHGRSPLFLCLPELVTRIVAGSARRGPRASLGQMLQLKVMDDAMPELGLSHRDISLAALPSNRPLRRALLLEGRILLKYAGLKHPPATMISRYARIFERDAIPSVVDAGPLRRLGSAVVMFRRDRTDLDELRRRLSLAVTLFECSTQGAAASMRLHRRSWIGTVLGLGLLGTAVLVDIVRIRLARPASSNK